MPRGVYPRMHKVTRRAKVNAKLADSLLSRQLKESLATLETPKTTLAEGIANKAFITGTGYLSQAVPFEELHKKYEQLSMECEGLRRVIGSQKETIDTLCRAMIEINAVEGRWR